MSLKARFRGVIRYQTGPPAIFLLILSRSERAGEFFWQRRCGRSWKRHDWRIVASVAPPKALGETAA